MYSKMARKIKEIKENYKIHVIFAYYYKQNYSIIIHNEAQKTQENKKQ